MIPAPFIRALHSGTVDVPLLMGNMAEEPDAGPAMEVASYSSEQFLKLLQQTFEPWGSDVGNNIYELYATVSAINPQIAYDQIISDYGLTCAFIDLGRTADMIDGGSYSSPVYIHYNNWGFANPIVESNGWTSHYAHHGSDLMLLLESWGSHYQPDQRDFLGAASIQKIFFAFVNTNGRYMSDAFGITTFSDSSGWPSNYSTISIEYPSPRMRTNLKKEVCEYFTKIGINSPKFWWEN